MKKNELLINKFTIKNKNEIERIRLSPITDDYPFSIPVIKNFKEFSFKKQVTFIIGENGSGKSTIIEAFARSCGFKGEGGSKYFKFKVKPYNTVSSFYKYLNVDKSWEFPVSDGYFLRSETLYNLATEINYLEDSWEIKSDYGDISLHNQSDGESVLSLLKNRISKRGLYIFDEPETGLSTKNLFVMLTLINNLVKIQSQFIISTHSPILLAFPNCEIYEIKDGKLQLIRYEDTDYYNLTKYFMLNYGTVLKNLGVDDSK